MKTINTIYAIYKKNIAINTILKRPAFSKDKTFWLNLYQIQRLKLPIYLKVFWQFKKNYLFNKKIIKG
jgi:hypothetical protein